MRPFGAPWRGMQPFGEPRAWTVPFRAGFTLSGPTTVTQNTTATNDLTADGYTWATGSPLVVDEFGKLIAWAMATNGGTNRHIPVVSNDSGATWSEPTHTGFGPNDNNGEYLLARCAQAYDATNHLLHVLWVLPQAAGAVIYRQYSFTRDGSNNITGVARVRSLQMEVGAAGLTYEAPVALWCADVGKVVVGWSVRTAAVSEYRLTMRTVSNSAADTTLANWVAPFNENAGAGATDTTGSSGLPKYSCPAKSASPVDLFLALCRKSAGAATHAKDLYFAYHVGAAVWFNRATWASGTGDWRTGFGAAIALDSGKTKVSNIQRAGTDAGYSLKFQLVSKLVEDTANDKLWVGCSTWKDNTAGDTWTIWAILTDDTVSAAVDVYAAGATNTDAGRDIFVTGDVMFDATSGYVIASYTDLLRHDAYLTAYQNGTVVQSNLLAYSATPCDIPTLYDTRVNNRIAILFRDFNVGARSNPPTYTPPYTGRYVSVAVS